MNSLAGERAETTSSERSQGSNQGATALSCSQSASVSRSRGQTCPPPNGTGPGNSSPTGHSTSSARPPALRSMNQRSRTACQRSTPPRKCRPRPMSAPSTVPAMLSARSTFEEIRCGRKFCSISIASDSAAPAATAAANERDGGQPERTSATKTSTPSGR